MNKIFAIFLFVSTVTYGQNTVIPLYDKSAPGSQDWTWKEKEKTYEEWNSKIVYNVTNPSLTVFQPDPSIATGAAVIVCPGGGFQFLSIESEGNDVAKWLTSKGVAAFVLRYRLSHTVTDDPVKELYTRQPNTPKFNTEIRPIVSMAITDGKTAVAYVRAHASEFNISPDRIGIMGFSAGGTVATGVAYTYDSKSRPDFVIPIYPYVGSFPKPAVPTDAPPMFIVAASDDDFGFNIHCIELYKDWVESKHSAELHIYAKGGHGFGMNTLHLPVDSWIDRFGDWLNQQGFAKGTEQPPAQQVLAWKQTLQDWPNLKRYAENDKDISDSSQGTVVFMGNSITEGWYRLDSAFFISNRYIDRGISGQTTPQMLLRFRQDVIELKPSVVVILAGTNDIAQNTGPMTLEQSFGNIVSMTQLARANNIRVVISSVLPASDFPWRPGLQPADKIVQLNAMLKTYAEKNGLTYVDYFSAMADQKNGLPKSLSEDGVHPNISGYKIMEPLVKKAITDALTKD